MFLLRERLRPHGPRLLVAFGVLRGIGVAAVTALLGFPLWVALVLAAIWSAAPAIGAQVWKRRRVAQQLRASVSDVARPDPRGAPMS